MVGLSPAQVGKGTWRRACLSAWRMGATQMHLFRGFCRVLSASSRHVFCNCSQGLTRTGCERLQRVWVRFFGEPRAMCHECLGPCQANSAACGMRGQRHFIVCTDHTHQKCQGSHSMNNGLHRNESTCLTWTFQATSGQSPAAFVSRAGNTPANVTHVGVSSKELACHSDQVHALHNTRKRSGWPPESRPPGPALAAHLPRWQWL